MYKPHIIPDDRDNKIISLLLANAEITETEIAEKLKVSQPSVHYRLKELIKRNIIKKKWERV